MKQIKTQEETICTLTKADVVGPHEILSKNYTLLKEVDPVYPPGIKNEANLEMAVERQLTGFDNWYKYSRFYQNCATLVYGIVKGHAFHNGNKRTGLLAMIKHLYVNGYVLKPSLRHNNIYNFVLAMSDNKLYSFANKDKYCRKWLKQYKYTENTFDEIDTVIHFIGWWIKSNSVSKNIEIKGKVKLSKLRNILNTKCIIFEQHGNKIGLYKLRDKKILGVKISDERYYQKEYSLGNSTKQWKEYT